MYLVSTYLLVPCAFSIHCLVVFSVCRQSTHATQRNATQNNTMASSTPDSDNKRRRTAPPDDGRVLLSIYHLLPYHLTAIADYLPQTSRALFAVASRPNDNEASKAVIASTANEGWETLDFADVGDLAARLNDSDVQSSMQRTR